MTSVNEKLKFIDDKLKEVISKEGIEKKFSSSLFKLWNDYLYTQNTGNLSGDKKGWAAALYYILKKPLMKKAQSQAKCAKQFGVSASNLGRKYRKIKKEIVISDYQVNWQEQKGKEKTSSKEKQTSKQRKRQNQKSNIKKVDSDQAVSKAQEKSIKQKRKIKPGPLSDEKLINIFKSVQDLISQLYDRKDYFEIKRFLQYVEINLLMTGYEVELTYLEEKFGQLFTSLEMVPKKGRDAEKFVRITDKYGNIAPYVLIRLRGKGNDR